MTDVKAVPQSSIDPDVTSGVAQFLAPVVIDLQALAVDGKQAHWHVRGSNFQGVHELLDMVVAHAQDYADTAAERVVALGLPIDARIATLTTILGPAIATELAPRGDREQPNQYALHAAPWSNDRAATDPRRRTPTPRSPVGQTLRSIRPVGSSQQVSAG